MNTPGEVLSIQSLNPPSNSTQSARTYIKNLILSCRKIPTAAALLDQHQRIRYCNPACTDLLSSFNYPENQTFINTFSRSLSRQDANKIYQQLTSAADGYSWRGQLAHKTRERTTILTSAMVIPFFGTSSGAGTPMGWTLYLHDITIETNTILQRMFQSLLEASKLKDNDTGKHIERVNLYSKILAQKLYDQNKDARVDADFVENIGFLAAMHDVGKIGTPDDILNKQGPLNDFEWAIMREHTINGAFILSSHPDPMARQIAQSHHERWDGSGYPFKLMADMIPLPARIVAVADVYDALRMRRSYKEPFTHEKACEIIAKDAGKHFDPDLVLIFQNIHPEFDMVYQANAD
ncbi:MAG: HD domain-containing protein [Spirochaetes bacterium]|nr:HD domain-containing protein [Spirochaetota bacterium]MBU0955607.1 HD domain-containing protein [Spirochaetota bacterium]